MQNCLIHNLIKKTKTKNSTEVTLNLLLNVIGDSNDDTNFSNILLLTERQVLRLRKAFSCNQLM